MPLFVKVKAYLLFAACALNLFFALFLWIKNPKDRISINVGLTAFFSAIYAGTYGMRYIGFFIFSKETNELITKLTWFGLPAAIHFLAFSYYLSQKLNHFRIKILLLYFFVAFSCFLSITTPLMTIPYSLKINYGLYSIYAEPGPLQFLARFFLLLCTALGTYNFLKTYNKATGFRRKQLKYFALGIAVYDFALTIGAALLPLLFKITTFIEVPAFVSVIWLGLTTFAIVRYRLLEIDTVIHRTLMWLVTSLWLIIPAYILFKATHLWLKTLSPLWVTMVAMGLFYVFLWYYRYFQPRIDHLFRRRKYDYYEVLNGLGQKIGSELELEKIQGRIFKELKEILYIRKGVLLAQHPGQVSYEEVGSVSGEGITDLSRPAGSSLLSLPFSSKLSQYINKEQKSLEREQVEADPQYQEIREEALAWLKEKEIEVLIPIVLEGKVNGLIGIGKKENLQGYTRKDIELLENMGQQIGITIDNALHHGDIIEKERMDEELKLGREIQMNLLPREIPRVPNLSLQGLMIPAKEIGGDYYDFIVLPNKEEVAIVIGDVSGKGVAAGLIMATAKATLKGLSQQRLTAKEMLTQANTIIYEYTNGEKFMTMLYLQWDSMEKKFRYSSAGHEHILIYRAATEKTETILSGGIVLGMLPDIESFLEEKEITFHSGDKILLYTDGVTDADNQQGERFGLTRLQESFQRHSRKPAAELIVAVKDEVYGFIGNQPQYDDITIVAMEIQ